MVALKRQKQSPSRDESFSALLPAWFTDIIAGQKRIAVAVSGGPDSLALCSMLSRHAKTMGGPSITALCVDHGLRSESAMEAQSVLKALKKFHAVTPRLLTWEGEKPQTRIQEEARKARYDMMAAACEKEGISYLCLAHHQDDQAETVLFRLAKGSGLDGLAGMAPVQRYNASLTFLRPLLDVPKSELIRLCDKQGLSYVCDPSNASARYARPRLRAARPVLEEEGLSNKRLAKTAERLARVRSALESISEKALVEALIESQTQLIVLDYVRLRSWPEEIVLRALLKAMSRIGAEQPYGPRMEKTERVVHELLYAKTFRRQTLGGVILGRDDKKGCVFLQKEA